MTIRSLFRSLQRRLDSYAPLIEISISKSALLYNLHTYQKAHPDMELAPVLKSNAYGHGLTTVAKLLDNEDIAFFMVDSLFEARQLRIAGIRSRILVMGYVRPRDMRHIKLRDIDFAVVAIEQLRELSGVRSPLRLHLKLDTGMHRQGITEADLPEAIDLVREQAMLSVVGVCSHLGDADGEDETNTKRQVAVWQRLSRLVSDVFPAIEFRHLAATKGVRFAKEAHTNVIRLGIGLYGIDTSPRNTLTLKPVLSMRSSISSVRSVLEGEWVGYNGTYTADAPRRIASIPVGYYEGVDRALSNRGFMEVGGIQCPIVGRVSMNMASIDVTGVPSAKAGTSVMVISPESDQPNSVERMASLAHTTPYVLLAHIPAHLRRSVER